MGMQLQDEEARIEVCDGMCEDKSGSCRSQYKTAPLPDLIAILLPPTLNAKP